MTYANLSKIGINLNQLHPVDQELVAMIVDYERDERDRNFYKFMVEFFGTKK